jgi:hypothetical protein
MFAENTAPFLADFCVTALWTGTAGSGSALVIFDKPDVVVAGGRAISTEYRITYLSADFAGLAFGDTVTIDSVAYQVLEVLQLDDGTFSEARLEAQ